MNVERLDLLVIEFTTFQTYTSISEYINNKTLGAIIHALSMLLNAFDRLLHVFDLVINALERI